KDANGDKRHTGEMPVISPKTSTTIPKVTLPLADDDDGDAPIPEVPRLKKADDNGKNPDKKEEKPTDEPR
ncbi:MAG: hypothetical protein CUN52_10480, partial [Phototrophicales bacterium]